LAQIGRHACLQIYCHAGDEADLIFAIRKTVAVATLAVAMASGSHAETSPTTGAVAGPSILLDAASGEVLSLNRAGEPWYPASLTKLMTAYVVFQKIRAGEMSLDQQVAVSALAASQAPSKIGLPTGQTVSVDWALQALLVYSANDMAYVLAEGASDTIAGFARDMNKAANDLGMSATHYVNPNGLFDPRQVTSARDLGVLAAVMLKQFPEHAHYFSQQSVAVGRRQLRNHNNLLNVMPDADGMKTGFVCDSGYNLVSSATRNGRKLIAVVLGAKSGYGRTLAAKSMLENGFATTASATAPTIATIANIQRGVFPPKDMTPEVCRRKNPVLSADAADMSGWSVSFGTYDKPSQADTALRLRMVSPAGFDAPARGGVLTLPDKKGYAAVMWGLGVIDGKALCAAYQKEGAACEALPPAFAQSIAAANELARVKVDPSDISSQGSDDTPKRKMKSRKRIHRKIR
jgi:D-alanyl-D-alanine carboxypeptidase